MDRALFRGMLYHTLRAEKSLFLYFTAMYKYTKGSEKQEYIETFFYHACGEFLFLFYVEMAHC